MTTAKDVKRAFVQARMKATGRSDAASRAKFRARFDSLASTKEGRQKIATVTGMGGIKKLIKPSTSTAAKSTSAGSWTSKGVQARKNADAQAALSAHRAGEHNMYAPTQTAGRRYDDADAGANLPGTQFRSSYGGAYGNIPPKVRAKKELDAFLRIYGK